MGSVKLRKKSTRNKLFKLNRRAKRRVTRFAIIMANFAIVGVVGLIAVNANGSNPRSASASQSQALYQTGNSKPLDSLSSADMAVHVARLTGLQEATAVANKADTVNAQLAVAAADDTVVAKPQIVGAGLKSKKDIKDYKTIEGDTVPSLAAKFGVTPDTIRFSNNITGDTIAVGRDITISPINGIVYTVKEGDTPDAVAARFYANKDNVLVFNDAEETGNFKVGERVVIPDGVQPAPPAPSPRARTSGASSSYSVGFAFGSSAVYGSNGYDYGWCTWHAANRRKEIGRPIPNNLGNAVSWLSVARRAGLPAGSDPQPGAVVYHKNIGGLGHVAFVEKINEDGSALVSDMNYPSWGRVTYRTITPGEFGSYAFIY